MIWDEALIKRVRNKEDVVVIVTGSKNIGMSSAALNIGRFLK